MSDHLLGLIMMVPFALGLLWLGMVDEMSDHLLGLIMMVPFALGLLWLGAQIDNDKEDK